MDTVLCDELLQEIFQRLPPSSSYSVSLVCKRWLFLYRSSTTSLSLRLIPHPNLFPSLSSLLSQHPSLSSLSLLSSSDPSPSTTSHLLSLVSNSCFSPTLLHLRFLAGPLSLPSLSSLSKSCTRLTSLFVTLPRPITLTWLLSFPCLRDLSIVLSSDDSLDGGWVSDHDSFAVSDSNLGLESLCLVGIRGDDWGIGWLWRSCKNLRRLQLRSCQGIGGSYSSFGQSLQGLQELELRTCRTVVDMVLLKLSENCISLNSLLVYDGGSREGLLHFFTHCRSNLRKIDLRLPLDLDNSHLFAVAANFRGLVTLRLQSCCLVTGEGLKALAIAAASNGLEELALINCDVVEREHGLLATLGQHLRALRKLDLSHSEMLIDKELISMLVSCVNLIELRLRGCKRLTGAAMVSILRSCKRLETVDIVHCFGIESEAIEMFMKNSPRLRRIQVEEYKLSDAARMWASNKFIQVVV
ncbi:hypothetical protein HN51_016790 [Arachis hypogaea]|uniref:F-box/LRR-repeat protein 4 n=1 Tax=Arachis stenosperma TaxID=217475 RepID=UPI0025ACDDD6|nr:F-box/LRR-repeat protein 4 [Arachis stenosperma]